MIDLIGRIKTLLAQSAAIKAVTDLLPNAGALTTIGADASIAANGTINYGASHRLSVTADFTSVDWNAMASHEVFTVTGLVRIRMWIEVTGNVDSLAHGATVSFGHDADTDAYILATDEEALDTGELWYDNSPTLKEDAYGNAVIDRVVNGLDIGYTVEGEALTTGSMVFHCVWEPMNAAGDVDAGTGVPL